MINRIKIFLGVFAIALVLVTSCGKKETVTASEILLKSIEAHGGIKTWENIKQISYRKTTILYDSLGRVEKKLAQWHENSFYPDFTAKMEWIEDSIIKQVQLKSNEVSVIFDDSIVGNKTLKENYKKDVLAANYVFWQPYKLLDTKATLHYIGKDTLDSKQTHVIKVLYDNQDKTSNNNWWYYFDADTYKLVATMVHYPPTYSLIKNISYEDKTGLSLNAKRKSYRVDSLRNIQFLRAEYDYGVLDYKRW